MDTQPEETTIADRGALALIGLMLGAATLMVSITAAVAVTDFRGGEMRSVANVPVAAMAPVIAR
jgi:hypothetical protein